MNCFLNRIESFLENKVENYIEIVKNMKKTPKVLDNFKLCKKKNKVQKFILNKK